MPEEVTAIRKAVFDAVRHGRSLTPEAVASSSGLPIERIREASELMASHGVLDVDDQGRLEGTGGLTLRATPHSLVLAGTPLHTWCAIDVIGIPVGLEEDARVATPCRYCKAPLEFDVIAGVRTGNPDAVAWFPTASCSNLSQEFCTQANLFCNSDHLEAWRQTNGGSDGVVLSIAEVEEVGRLAWKHGADPALFDAIKE